MTQKMCNGIKLWLLVYSGNGDFTFFWEKWEPFFWGNLKALQWGFSSLPLLFLWHRLESFYVVSPPMLIPPLALFCLLPSLPALPPNIHHWPALLECQRVIDAMLRLGAIGRFSPGATAMPYDMFVIPSAGAQGCTRPVRIESWGSCVKNRGV